MDHWSRNDTFSFTNTNISGGNKFQKRIGFQHTDFNNLAFNIDFNDT